MSIDDYIKINNLSYQKLAERIDFCKGHLWRIAKRKIEPSLRVAILIAKASDWHISLASMLKEDSFLKKAPRKIRLQKKA